MASPNADATFEPMTPHVSRSDGQTWLGHPRQLARLFSVEAWERFGFYGLRALLVLYLTNHFLLSDHESNGIVGGYLSLAYLTPVVGGWVADRYLGSKRSVKFGAIMMSLGYLLLCFGGQPAKPLATFDGQSHAVHDVATGGTTHQYIDGADGKPLLIHGLADGSVQLVATGGAVTRTLAPGALVSGADRPKFYVGLMLLGLSIVAVGNGLFKPNISTVVGTLYPRGDPRRDAGFTIFYWGINLGSMGSQTLCPLFVSAFGWWAGFLLVAVGMAFAYVLMRFDGGRLDGYGEPPVSDGKDRAPWVYAVALAVVPLVFLVLLNVMDAPEATGSGVIGYLAALPFLGKVLMATFAAAVIGIPIWSYRVGTRVEAQMMLAAVVLVVFNVAFWTLFEQAASSLTLFADRSTTLELFGIPISAAQTQNFNSITIVIFAPIMSWVWTALARKGWEPSIPVKFGLALVLVGLGFVLLASSGHFAAGPVFRVSLWWLVATYFLHSIAELLISPVGLSMITKLSIARVVGLMMGVWFLSMSVAEYLAGAIAQAASVQTVGGQVTNAELGLRTYLSSFQTGGISTIVVGLVLLALTPVIKRLMHGVR